MKLYKSPSYMLVTISGVSALAFSQSRMPVNTMGQNAFVALNDAAGDVRGPCPGLNALANHGYIPHNGVTSLLEVVSATNKVFGMGVDLATALAAMSTAWVGNPLSISPGFSIGGSTESSKNLLNDLFGLTGTPQGLTASHNWIEADSSNTRNDPYMTGDSSTLDLEKFMGWYDMSSDTVGNYDMASLASRANMRFQESKAENPYFYYGPFTGMVARSAGYIFAGRMFANYSNGNYAGVLSSIGGNTGTVDSFTGIDIGNLTGGIYNTETLLRGDNLICFVLQFVKTLSPGALSTLYTNINGPLGMITNAINIPLLNMACPSFATMMQGGASWEEEVQSMFPGARRSRGGI